MSERGADRRTVLALSIALGAALLLIAFLLGRESAGTATGEAGSAQALRPAGLDPDQVERSADEENSRRWPAWADLEDDDTSGLRATDASGGVAQRVDIAATDRVASTQNQDRPQPQPRPSAPGDARPDQRGASPASYFQEVDLIRSEEGAGDPNVFAMKVINGGFAGATSGFDQLIADARLMERKIQRLTPPASCKTYHQASIEALVETREMLERMKRAIVGRDIEQLNAIALESKTLHRKALEMTEMRKQILAEDGTN